MTSVVIADDHPLLLKGLEDLLSAQADIDVVGTSVSGTRAWWMIRELKPDIAILDVSMPDPGGMAILRSVAEQGVSTMVILLTAMLTGRQVAEAIEFGVRGLLLKESAPEILLECVRHVASNRRWLPPELLARSQGEQKPDMGDRIGSLTSRELEVARLICDGLSNRAIACTLQMSEGTVGVHLQNIYRKLEITNRTMLAAVHLRERLDNV